MEPHANSHIHSDKSPTIPLFFGLILTSFVEFPGPESFVEFPGLGLFAEFPCLGVFVVIFIF